MATEEYTTERAAVLWLLKHGHMNPSEAARMAGASRQLVMHWLKTSKTDWRKARADRLGALWKQRTKR